MRESRDVELLVDAHARVGEGPIWEPRDNTLLWVDILNHLVHRYDPASGRDESFDVGQDVGTVASRASGGWVLAVRTGFASYDPATRRFEMLAAVEADMPGNHMNDGKVDRAGRFWAGTMPDDWKNHRGTGSLYRLGTDRRVDTMLGGLSIANGIGWSPDDRLMYYVDSPTLRVDVFDYDAPSGAIRNRRLLIEVPAELGVPDGLCVDSEGFIWLAVWGSSSIRRYDPKGTLERIVHVPASQSSSCCFGGPDLTDLYITTAAEGLSAETLRTQPHAGGLFRHRPGVKGLPPNSYAG